MSCDRDDVDQSMAYMNGHSDAWERKPPALPCSCLSCPTNSKYKEGHQSGVTARYYYDKGYAAGKADHALKY